MKTRTTQFLIVCILITLLCVVGVYVEFRYIYSIENSADALKVSLVDSQIQSLKLESLRAVAVTGSTELSKIENYIVPPGKEIDVVQRVESLADHSSLDHSTDLIEKKDGGSKGQDLLHIKISTDGSWADSRKFISLIEHIPYNVRINEVDMLQNGIAATTSIAFWHTKIDFQVVEKKDVQQ